MNVSRPGLSLIVPTRHRIESLQTCLDSLYLTATSPPTLEVILVVDDDDPATLAFQYEKLTLRKVVVPPGQTMGRLNAEGARASRGDFVMLLNDDVIVRTRGWDEKVLRRLRRYHDGVVLVHVNDTLLRDNLCTFPLVSRTFCELAGDICPDGYVRYRIDDHIEDVFNLLVVLGHKRTIYLPDVVFEHRNCVVLPDRPPEYHAVPEILAVDAPRFLELFPERKRLALKLLERIEGPLDPERLKRVQTVLDSITDPFSLRIPGRQRWETDVPIPWRLGRSVGSMAERGLNLFRRKGFTGLIQAIRRRLGGSAQDS